MLHKGVVMKIFNADLGKDPNESIIKTPRIYVPSQLEDFFIEHFHRGPLGAHIQSKVMKETLAKTYYFPNIDEKIAEVCNKCRVCYYTKIDTLPPQTFGKTREPIAPFEMLVADLAISLPKSKNAYKHIFVMMEAYSRFLFLMPLKSKHSAELLEAFARVYLPIGGYPQYFTSDCEKSLIHGPFFEQLSANGTTFTTVLPYRPQSNSLAEAAIGKAKRALTNFCIEKGSRADWDIHLPEVAYTLNHTEHTSTKISPFEALFGFRKSLTNYDLLRVDTFQEPEDENDEFYQVNRIITI